MQRLLSPRDILLNAWNVMSNFLQEHTSVPAVHLLSVKILCICPLAGRTCPQPGNLGLRSYSLSTLRVRILLQLLSLSDKGMIMTARPGGVP